MYLNLLKERYQGNAIILYLYFSLNVISLQIQSFIGFPVLEANCWIFMRGGFYYSPVSPKMTSPSKSLEYSEQHQHETGIKTGLKRYSHLMKCKDMLSLWSVGVQHLGPSPNLIMKGDAALVSYNRLAVHRTEWGSAGPQVTPGNIFLIIFDHTAVCSAYNT